MSNWKEKAYVADTNALGLAGSGQLLHLLPAIDVVVRSDNISGTVLLGGELVMVTLGVEEERPVLHSSANILLLKGKLQLTTRKRST